MATATTTSPPPLEQEMDQSTRPLQEIRDFWRQFFFAAFNPYRPEQHYMRGPGPAWRAKHGKAKHP
ncbi:MAG: hypothetical protein HXX15_15870 [Rhodopseudomonas sp.]|nr:hypothetical protein [Rhodopseudomonas sp.]